MSPEERRELLLLIDRRIGHAVLRVASLISVAEGSTGLRMLAAELLRESPCDCAKKALSDGPPVRSCPTPANDTGGGS